MTHRMSRRVLVAAAITIPAIRPGSASEVWPTRPIRMIAPLPPGSLPDITMRIFAEGLTRRLGQPVVPDNRPGGEGVVATSAFLNLNDDHRLFFSFAGPITVNPLTMERLAYDPAHLVPLSSAALDYIVVAGAPDLPAGDLRQAVALALARPGALAWAAAPGAIGLAFEGFAAAQRLDLLRAAYRSPQDAMTDLGAGRIQLTVMPLAAALPHAQAGRAKLLAVTNGARAPAAPEVPTTAEQGFHDYAFQGFVGVFGPPDMPPTRRLAVSEAVRAVAAEPEVVRRLAAAGQVAQGSTPEAFAAMIAAQRAQVAAGLTARGGAPR
jgi:tripartite-type tricarboxylate transporter receptor subunit TctC